jgi:flagellar biosynthesis protein FlhF
MGQKTVPIRGFLGLRTRDGVELNGYVPNEPALYPIPGLAPGPRAAAKLPHPQIFDPEEEKAKIIKQSGKADTVKDMLLQNEILSKIESLIEKVDSGKGKPSPDHPTITKIEALLRENDFSPVYSRGIIEKMRKNFSIEQLEDYSAVEQAVLSWIGEDIGIFSQEENDSEKKPRIVALVGPTGVGKTTTIAKLAAIYGPLAPKNSQSVRLITIDNYRIAAKEQLERYGQWMHVPVASVKNNEELKKYIALNTEGTDLFLVDTIGRSPRKAVELAEMKELLSAWPMAEYHLVIDAKTKTSDIAEIMRDFETFNYKSVLVTKMDESSKPGNIISLLRENRKEVSYVTTGQNVPRDIERANPLRFLINLEGFNIDKRSMEKKFGRLQQAI